MLFTVLYIKKAKKIYKNSEELEINYHKYFMKKFGLHKGAVISAMISTTYLIIVCYILTIFNKEILLFILGMSFTMAYVNYISWISYDEIRKKLQYKKNAKDKSIRKNVSV